MDRELFAGITAGELVYMGSAILVGLVLALTTRLIANRLKGRLRRRVRTSIGAQLVDDIDGALALWMVLTGVYLGLLGLPLLGDHLSALRQGFTVFSIVLAVYAGIRVQGDAVAWAIRRIGRRTGQSKVLNSMAPMAKRIVSIAIMAMGILIILDQLGISIAPLVAGLGITGLAVALALQGTLTNFFAGLNVMTDGSIRVGDFVELDSGTRGEVEQIGWRTTRIRPPSNNLVIIPNSRLAESIAINYNYPTEEMSVYLYLGVAYSSDLEHVERVTVEVAKKVQEETPRLGEGLRALHLVCGVRRFQHQLLGDSAVSVLGGLLACEARLRQGPLAPLQRRRNRDLLPKSQHLHAERDHWSSAS
jgi:small-conductance mechanosensitive channel